MGTEALANLKLKLTLLNTVRYRRVNWLGLLLKDICKEHSDSRMISVWVAVLCFETPVPQDDLQHSLVSDTSEFDEFVLVLNKL